MAKEVKSSKPDPCFGAELEYEVLRDEILARVKLRQNLIAITLTLGGIFLGVGLKIPVTAAVYPPIAFFLALAWAQNDFRVRDLANYIREKIEPCLPACQWESYISQNRNASGLNSWRFVVLAHGGVFLFTQIFSILLAMKGVIEIWDNGLIWPIVYMGILSVLDILSVFGVIWILKNSSR